MPIAWTPTPPEPSPRRSPALTRVIDDAVAQAATHHDRPVAGWAAWIYARGWLSGPDAAERWLNGLMAWPAAALAALPWAAWGTWFSPDLDPWFILRLSLSATLALAGAHLVQLLGWGLDTASWRRWGACRAGGAPTVVETSDLLSALERYPELQALAVEWLAASPTTGWSASQHRALALAIAKLDACALTFAAEAAAQSKVADPRRGGLADRAKRLRVQRRLESEWSPPAEPPAPRVRL